MKKLRALVLSGGGSKGAYQVGVLSRLLGTEKRCYDLFAGVSVGAINAAHLAQYPTGEETKAYADLLSLWSSISTATVYRRWCPFGKVHAAWQPSLYNSHPLRMFLQKHFDQDRLWKSRKQLRVGAVSLNTGRYTVFDETTEDVLDAVLASASFPGYLLPITIDGDLWTDGGVRNVTPLKCAIDAGATDIDVIMTSPDPPEFSRLLKPNALEVGMRAIDIMGAEIIEADIKHALCINKLVEASCGGDKRHVNITIYRPAYSLGVGALNFDPVKIRKMIQRGVADVADPHTRA